MAERNPPAKGKPSRNLEQHPLVEALVPDPSQGPQDATILRGYLGKSPTPGVWRLYLTPALDEYVEIPEGDILHTQDLPDGGGTLVWVPKSLSLSHVRTQSTRAQADFLSGAIASRAVAGAGPAPVSRAVPQPTPPIVVSVHTICPTPTVIQHCPITLPFCPSEAMIGCGASAVGPCASHQLVGCPSHHFGCPTFAPFLCVHPSFLIRCPTLDQAICVARTIDCPIASAVACPSLAGCPSIQCGLGGLGGGPVEGVG